MWWFICLFIIICWCQLSEANSTFPQSELSTLSDLYDSLNGWNWYWRTNVTYYGIPWNFSTINPNPCIDQWQGIACDYNNMTYQYHVIEVDLIGQNLYGILPTSISNLTNLESLRLSLNTIYGSLPSTITSLSALINLGLDINKISGTLPVNIGQLTQLKRFTIANNYLTGILPVSIGNLTQLRIFDCSFNYLTSTIPSSIGNLEYLLILRLEFNEFTGTIPIELLQLHHLIQYYLSTNQLTGSLPTNIFSSYPNLTTLYVLDNLLTGTIPSPTSINSLLFNVALGMNIFTGTLPIFYGNCPLLQYFAGSFNLLTGPLPSEYSQLVNLESILLGNNLLTSTIPLSYTQSFSQLIIFSLNNNWLTSTVPNLFHSMLQIQYYELQHNLFSGEFFFPTFNTSFQLLNLNISSNYLSGTLSANNFLSSTNLTSLDLSYNCFDGSLLINLQYLFLLQIVFLQHNQFTGSITNVFHPSINTQMAYIDLSDNQFSGTIPEEIYQLTTLQSLALSKNCFSGSISSQICQLTDLHSLTLDGLHASPSCINYYFPYFQHYDQAYSLNNAIYGSIPQCVYSLPSLSTLHFSGNGLTGYLPTNIPLSPTLSDLSISHNSFHGTIPTIYQHKRWDYLDLSFNRFTGQLFPNFTAYFMQDSTSKLQLQVNHLSGRIPGPLHHAYNIQILRGSLYDCQWDKADLPINDPYHNRYKCGSVEVDFFLVIFFILLFFLLLLCIVWLIYQSWKAIVWSQTTIKKRFHWICEYVHTTYKKLFVYPQSWWKILLPSQPSNISLNEPSNELPSEYSPIKYPHLTFVMYINSCVRRISFVLLCFSLFVYLPMNSLFVNYYGIYQYHYTWVISPIYLSGQLPAYFLVFTLLLFLSWLSMYYQILLNMLTRLLPNETTSTTTPTTTSSTSLPSANNANYNNQDKLNRQSSSIPEITTQEKESIVFNEQINAYLRTHSIDYPNAHTTTSHQQEDLEQEESQSSEQSSSLSVQSTSEQSSTTNSTKRTSLFAFTTSFFTRTTMSISNNWHLSSFSFSFSLPKSSFFQQCLQVVQNKLIFYGLCLFIFLLNTSIVMLINILFVYASSVNMLANYMILFTLFISGFKILWNNRMILINFRSFLQISEIFCFTFQSYHTNLITEMYVFFYPGLIFLFVLILFNYIAAPTLAYMTVSARCFNYLITSPPEITSQYTFPTCFQFVFIGQHYYCYEYGKAIHAITFIPPFTYSYECSSVLLANFTLVFLLRYLLSGIFIPCFMIGLKYYQEYRLKTNQNKSNSQSMQPLTSFERWLFSFLPPMLRIIPPEASVNLPSLPVTTIELSSQTEKLTENPLQSNQIHAINSNNNNNTVIMRQPSSMGINPLRQPSINPQYPMNQQYPTSSSSNTSSSDVKLQFDINSYLIILLSDIAVLFTFGLAFPPLACLIFISIFMQTMMNQLLFGRIVSIIQHNQLPHLHQELLNIDKQCQYKHMLYLIIHCVRWIVIFTVLFWSFFFFDILGSEVGWKKAIWILLLTICFPVFLYGLNYVLKPNFLFYLRNNEGIKKMDETNVKNVKYFSMAFFFQWIDFLLFPSFPSIITSEPTTTTNNSSNNTNNTQTIRRSSLFSISRPSMIRNTQDINCEEEDEDSLTQL